MTVGSLSGLGMSGLGLDGLGTSGSAEGVFGDLLKAAAEDAKKKAEQGAAAGITITSVSQLGGTATSDATSNLGGSATEEARKFLQQITADGGKGYWKWFMDQLREKVRGQVMQGMGESEQELAKMDPEARAALEKIIDQMVAEKVKEMMAEAALKQKMENAGNDRDKLQALLATI